MKHSKKFFVFLLGAVIIILLLFIAQFSRMRQITVKQTSAPLISDGSLNLPIDNTDQIFGNPGAAVTAVLYSNFSCKRCAEVYQILKEYVSAHPAEARLIWKGYPLSGLFSDDYALANKATYCAGKQNKLWPFLDALTQNNNNLTEPNLKNTAANLNLNSVSWWQCANSNEAAKKMDESLQIMKSIGSPNPPVLFINNKLINTDKDINIQELLTRFIAATKETEQQ